MIKKLISHGNSAALIIDKPILELLKVTINTPLEIATDGKNLIISPVKNTKRDAKFKTALEKINLRHGETLQKLSK
ncbi:MAG: AbrB family transcriptional regulator [Candidatus Brocadia carolinensis]|uniref:AbrB family transcriptional regulator n=1 Tax=Candidatus Brocadia carolinensis TaxID=1004156 RepID=A0A1V4ARB1_9BACT|nr:MAG: AbrB family transcriptional regulator [Candidatus Brocadia caroliniensis]